MENLRIVHKHIDLLELRRQVSNKAPDLIWIRYIELHGKDFDTFADFLLDLLGNLLECIYPSCSEDELEVLGRRLGEFNSCTTTNT